MSKVSPVKYEVPGSEEEYFKYIIYVFYCGASKTINLSLKVEEIHQSFGVKNEPNIFRNKSDVL